VIRGSFIFTDRNFPVYPPLFSVENELSAISHLWCRDKTTDIYNNCNDCPTNSTVTIDNNLYSSSGWDFCSDDGGIYQYFGYAIYKLSNSCTNNYFYIDFRDGNYGRNDNAGYLKADVTIQLNKNYDGNGNALYEYYIGNGQYSSLTNGSIIRVWEIPLIGPPQPQIFLNTPISIYDSVIGIIFTTILKHMIVQLTLIHRSVISLKQGQVFIKRVQNIRRTRFHQTHSLLQQTILIHSTLVQL